MADLRRTFMGFGGDAGPNIVEPAIQCPRFDLKGYADGHRNPKDAERTGSW